MDKNALQTNQDDVSQRINKTLAATGNEGAVGEHTIVSGINEAPKPDLGDSSRSIDRISQDAQQNLPARRAGDDTRER